MSKVQIVAGNPFSLMFSVILIGDWWLCDAMSYVSAMQAPSARPVSLCACVCVCVYRETVFKKYSKSLNSKNLTHKSTGLSSQSPASSQTVSAWWTDDATTG